ncbi:MAG: DUF6351 family protein [Actinomycetota bacterium]|nr:DUF6351 family protein [Actinomycetota bacterium]
MRNTNRISHILLAGLMLLLSGTPGRAGADGSVAIAVLSNRADLVSGDDALIAIAVPPGSTLSSVDVGGTDVTDDFVAVSTGRYKGLVAGLSNGANVLTATIGDGSGATLTITNRPQNSSILSGPQIQPWTCAASAKNMQCDRDPVYTYMYKPASGGSLIAYDPASPPLDALIGDTTTDNGETVKYIVRIETGAIDRDEYRIAELYQPGLAWTPTSPQPQWNHKLVITHGASCDTGYTAGAAPDVLNDTALSRGFAVMSNALDNAGHNCNIVTQGESLIMTKERVIDTLGEIRYTIGSGCSGGSLVQQQLANAYPGLYQGITPQCSYPDAWSSAMQYEDYNLMLQYFKSPSKWGTGVVWDPASIGFVIGHPNPANPITFTTVIPDSGNPTRSCPGLATDKMYNATTNPGGQRCTLYDYMVNVFGTVDDPAHPERSTWARVPWDNNGVQFGLKPLLAGKLTAQQFIDLNTKIGGFDIDHNLIPSRTIADDFAVKALYQSGAINQANNLNQVAIIDLRGPDPGAFHDVYRTYAIRARLEREHGTAANQVLWRGFVPLLGDTNYVAQSIIAIDGWLAVVEADHRDVPLAQKIREDRNVADRCTNGAGVDLPSPVCDGVVQSYTTPRIEAGMPFTDDVMKCQLKSMKRSDYYPVIFTDAQWSELQTAFPNGVCDYSKQGQFQQSTRAWQTYQDASGNVIYGGTPLGPPPESVPFSN